MRQRTRIRGFENLLDRIYDRIQFNSSNSQQVNCIESDNTSTRNPNLSTQNHAWSTPSSSSQSSSTSCSSITSISTSLPSADSSSSSQSVSSGSVSMDYQDPVHDMIDTHRDLIQMADNRDEIYGLSLVISQVFTECNLNESCQKRIYELIKIISRAGKEVMKYRQFKNVLNSLGTITAYKFLFCFVNNEIIDFPTRANCCDGAHGIIMVFNFADSIINIVNNNYKYLSCPHQQKSIDFTRTKLYKEIWLDVGEIDEDVLKITLIINIDDAQMIKSSRTCTTPVPFTVAEIPSYQRIAKQNMFNLGIFHGEKPCPVDLLWHKVLVEPFLALGILTSNDQQEITYTRDALKIETKYGDMKVLVRVGCVIMDSVAKAKSLNIKSFMGYYGCPYCLIEGTRLVNEEQRSAIFVYPYESDTFYPLKTKRFYSESANLAEANGGSYQGVKGKTILSDFIPVPDAVPIDYMHNILEGIFKFLLSLQPYKSKRVCQVLDSKVSQVRLPHDISRKFRKITELSYWKASECRTFLFHLIPLFRGIINDDSFMLLACLSAITRIFSIAASKVTRVMFQQATELIDYFLTSFQEIYGEEKMRFNLHLLSHYPRQYSKMGSLIDVSAFCFENNVFRLKRSFHGTRGHLDQMSYRYIIEKGIYNYKNDMKQWFDRYDPERKICPNFQCMDRNPFEPVGEQDSVYRIEERFISSISANFHPDSIKVFHSFRVNHVIYHSINYKYNRRSCSWAISYKLCNSNTNFGQILAFFTLTDHSCNCRYFALIKKFKTLERPFYVKNLKPTQQVLKRACSMSCFNESNKLIQLTNKILAIDCLEIESKLVLVPFNDNLDKFWASKIDFPFDHD